MRVLFAVSDWSAHYAPMVPLGWALQAAGHEVRVVCTPAQAEPLGAAGLTPVPILGGPDMVFQTRLMYWFTAKAGARPYPGMPLHPETGAEMASLDDFDYGDWMGRNKREVATAVKGNYEGTAGYARQYRADLVVHDPLAVEGLLAAKLLGVPAVQHHWGPVGSDESDPALRLLPPDPGGFFPRNGLGELTADQIEHVIDPCVDSLALPTRAHRIPVRYVPYNGPGEMPPWVLEEPRRPRVCVVWGNSLTAMFGPRSFVVPQIVEALGCLDVEVVLTGTPQDTGALGDLPSNVRMFERFPIRFLLPSCSAVVHHGGAGSAMTPLALGVPQLALTFAVEQEANGRRIAETGAGLQVRGDLATPEVIRESVRRLLEQEAFGKTARALAQENADRPAPSALVPVLERLAAGAPAPPGRLRPPPTAATAAGPPSRQPDPPTRENPMRVQFTVSDWPAHYQPMVPLGWALMAAGHDVRVVCAPSQAQVLDQAGLTPVPVLGDMDMVWLQRFDNLNRIKNGTWRYPLPGLHPDTGEEMPSLDGFDFDSYADECKRRVMRETRTGVQGALGFARAWKPDLVLHDRLSLEGVLSARVLGVPHVAHLWGPVGTEESDRDLYPLPVDYAGFFPRNGVPPMGPELIEYVIDPCPPSMRPPTNALRLPVRYVPYNGPGAMASWALEAPERPRVAVLWSNSVSSSYGAGSYLVPKVVRALAGLDLEMVLPVHPDDVKALGDLPSNVRAIERFPLRLLLPTCSAIVHHGGAGSVMTAVTAGVPQLGLTFGPEQDADASRLAATGAGQHITGDLADDASIRAAVQRLLTQESYRAAAARLRAENDERPAPAALVPLLERLAATGELTAEQAAPALAAGRP